MLLAVALLDVCAYFGLIYIPYFTTSVTKIMFVTHLIFLL